MTEPMTDEPTAFVLARPLRPAIYGSSTTDRIVEPVVEPQWTGVRVIAAGQDGGAVLLDDGESVPGHARLAAAFGAAMDRTTTGAIVEAYITKQAVTEDAVWVEDELPSTGRLIAQSMTGVRRNRTEEAAMRLEADLAARQFADEDIVNLVVVDLLWLDGDWLLETPLLERKRVLEAVLPGDDLVRQGVYVRPPIQTWIGSWRAQGFPGVTFRAANSRYRPGQRCDDWTRVSMPRR
ncbi:MAG TPA: hypothetical protein VD763_02310 [Candidatus Saccharimonadales bacterium]|nr:hypothetical protein [Candidatus Saccharimonadales bacterium]